MAQGLCSSHGKPCSTGPGTLGGGQDSQGSRTAPTSEYLQARRLGILPRQPRMGHLCYAPS